MDAITWIIPSLRLLAALLVVQPRTLMAFLAARAHGCLLSSLLTTKSIPTGLLPAQQPPACAIAKVSPLPGQKLAFALAGFHEVPTNTCSPPP